MVGTGAGAPASLVAGAPVARSFYPNGSVKGGTGPKGPRTPGSDAKPSCWVVNDDPFGTIQAACVEAGLEVKKNADIRLLQMGGLCSKQLLLAELNSHKQKIILGILKAPATHVGTKFERISCDNLLPLFGGTV